MTSTDKWLPMANYIRLTYNVPLEGGGFVSEKLVTQSVTEHTGKFGKTVIVPDQKDGTIHIISASLVTKMEKAEQNLKYGAIRWKRLETHPSPHYVEPVVT